MPGPKKRLSSPDFPLNKEGEGKRALRQQVNALLDFLNFEVNRANKPAFLRAQRAFFSLFYGPLFRSFAMERFGPLGDPEKMEELGISLALASSKPLCMDSPLDRQMFKLAQEIVSARFQEMRFWVEKTQGPETYKSLGKAETVFEVYIVDGVLVRYPSFSSLHTIDNPSFASSRNFTEEDHKAADRLGPEFAGDCLTFTRLQDKWFNKTAFATLSALFEKVPLTTIHECPECGKFYHATRKKQRPECKQCIDRIEKRKWLEKNREPHSLLVKYMREGHFDDLKDKGKLPRNPPKGMYIKIVREELKKA